MKLRRPSSLSASRVTSPASQSRWSSRKALVMGKPEAMQIELVDTAFASPS